ncbi:CCDC93 isoform 7, partial [Pan troglodytes]
QNLRALVAMNENLKSQEQEFKAHCREEMTRLQQEIENLKAERAPRGDEKTLSSGEPPGTLTSAMTHDENGLQHSSSEVCWILPAAEPLGKT